MKVQSRWDTAFRGILVLIRDQARDLNDVQVFLILRRSFCLLSSLPFLFLKLLSQLRTERSLILQGDNMYFSLLWPVLNLDGSKPV